MSEPRCTKCKRATKDIVVIATSARTDPRLEQIRKRMSEGECWFCAAGLPPCPTRGGVERPQKEVSSS